MIEHSVNYIGVSIRDNTLAGSESKEAFIAHLEIVYGQNNRFVAPSYRLRHFRQYENKDVLITKISADLKLISDKVKADLLNSEQGIIKSKELVIFFDCSATGEIVDNILRQHGIYAKLFVLGKSEAHSSFYACDNVELLTLFEHVNDDDRFMVLQYAADSKAQRGLLKKLNADILAVFKATINEKRTLRAMHLAIFMIVWYYESHKRALKIGSVIKLESRPKSLEQRLIEAVEAENRHHSLGYLATRGNF